MFNKQTSQEFHPIFLALEKSNLGIHNFEVTPKSQLVKNTGKPLVYNEERSGFFEPTDIKDEKLKIIYKPIPNFYYAIRKGIRKYLNVFDDERGNYINLVEYRVGYSPFYNSKEYSTGCLDWGYIIAPKPENDFFDHNGFVSINYWLFYLKNEIESHKYRNHFFSKNAKLPSEDNKIGNPKEANNSSQKTEKMKTDAIEFKFDVALSFAGENRDYVRKVAHYLVNTGKLKVFYDEFEDLWGKDLAIEFDKIYRKESRFFIPFISEHYKKKIFTKHEVKSAIARAMMEDKEYILPARFDDTELDGIRPTIAYEDISNLSAEEFARKIIASIIKKTNSIKKEVIKEQNEVKSKKTLTAFDLINQQKSNLDNKMKIEKYLSTHEAIEEAEQSAKSILVKLHMKISSLEDGQLGLLFKHKSFHKPNYECLFERGLLLKCFYSHKQPHTAKDAYISFMLKSFSPQIPYEIVKDSDANYERVSMYIFNYYYDPISEKTGWQSLYHNHNSFSEEEIVEMVTLMLIEKCMEVIRNN